MTKTGKQEKIEFINKTFEEFIKRVPFALHWSTKNSSQKANERDGEFAIKIDLKNAEVVLTIYQSALKLDEKRLEIVLAHEVGHIFIQDLDNVIENVADRGWALHKPEKENAIEKAATNIGWLLLESK